MNAPASIEVNAVAPGGKTPHIVVRDRRFGRGEGAGTLVAQRRPGGDGLVQRAFGHVPARRNIVRRRGQGVPRGRAAGAGDEIRAFIKQEVNHTREHLAFNRAAEAAGYDLTAINARVERLIGDVYARPKVAWLAVTIALEHFTAMFAHQFLAHPEHFVGAEVEQAELWRWHAVEELEHKGVAYDTWLHATRSWGAWKRWKLKNLAMLAITRRFIRNRFRDATDLLAQDGIAGPRAKARLVWYLVGSPGILRRVFPAWCAYWCPDSTPGAATTGTLSAGTTATTPARCRLMFAHRITVEPRDIDHMGHVNNAVYLRWVQDAVTRYWEAVAPAEAVARHLWVALSTRFPTGAGVPRGWPRCRGDRRTRAGRALALHHLHPARRGACWPRCAAAGAASTRPRASQRAWPAT
jgi:predicted metal-dependent hydrolase